MLMCAFIIIIPILLMMPFSEHDFSEAFFKLKYVIPFLMQWVGLFFFNYFWFVPKYYLQHRWKAYFLGNVIAFLFLGQVGGIVYGIVINRSTNFEFLVGIPWEIGMAFQMSTLFIAVLFAILAITLRSGQLNSYLQKEAERKDKELIHGELDRLKGQLNPHFLFNTLNNISSLAAFDPDGTQVAIGQLSEMLRYVLYETSAPKVPLQKDLDFLQNYIDLMMIRYDESLKLDVHLQIPHPETQIAPMLFISLLENAFKYGASSLHPCSIAVKLEETDGGLCFTVRNTLLTDEEMASKKQGGVGLVNLEKRLELLYPEAHKLTYGKLESDYYEAKLELTLPDNTTK